jgi:hypothetical protein
LSKGGQDTLASSLFSTAASLWMSDSLAGTPVPHQSIRMLAARRTVQEAAGSNGDWRESAWEGRAT